MSHKEALSKFARRCGYLLRDESTENFISLEGAHCLLTNENGSLVPGRCTITVHVDSIARVKIVSPAGAPNCNHCASVKLDRRSKDGLVYDAKGDKIGATIQTDGQRSSFLSINPGSQSSPRTYDDPYHCLLTYAKHICGPGMSLTRAARPNDRPDFQAIFEHRAGIQPMQNKVRGHSVAIFGLGGTGSYILDFMVKTSVARIHIFDDDIFEQHNIMRAPGAPDGSQLANISALKVCKVDYYNSKYGTIGKEIIPHRYRANADHIRTLMEQESIHFVFIAADQITDRTNPRQDELYTTLEDLGIDYIDVGMSIVRKCDKIRASLSVFVSTRFNRGLWKNAIPNSQLVSEAENPYGSNQICELNALNAALAVVEWRKIASQYLVDDGIKYHLKYKTESARIITQ